MPQPNEKDILEKLSQIIDPDLGKNIVELGFIKELTIINNDVSFKMELTTPGCPLKNTFKQKAEELVSSLSDVDKVSIIMTARERKVKAKHSGLSKVGAIIAVASCKGGVGKSTIAATMALETASRGFKTGLLDADIFGPSVPTLLTKGQVEIKMANNMLIPHEENNLKLMSFGFLTDDGPAIMRGPMVSSYIQQLLTQTDWGKLDYLFIDMPPGTGDIQLTISQTIRINGAIIVTTRSSLSLADVSKGILMFEKVGIPMLGIVENMSSFICDNCDKEHFIFGPETTSLNERFGLKTIAKIPLSEEYSYGLLPHKSKPLFIEMVDNTLRELGKISALETQLPEIKSDKDSISFKWNDQEEIKYDNHTLRKNCRCARCIDEYTGEKILKENDIPRDIHALEHSFLGNYAISIKWSDGHSSSIYPYDRIKNNLKHK